MDVEVCGKALYELWTKSSAHDLDWHNSLHEEIYSIVRHIAGGDLIHFGRDRSYPTIASRALRRHWGTQAAGASQTQWLVEQQRR